MTIECYVDENSSLDQVCDSFEVGIISHLEYEVYDIAIMITNTPNELLAHDMAMISFRLSHVNDSLMSRLAAIRIICMVISIIFLLMYCYYGYRESGWDLSACATLNIEQYWVLTLLLLCIFFDEPLF